MASSPAAWARSTVSLRSRRRMPRIARRTSTARLGWRLLRLCEREPAERLRSARFGRQPIVARREPDCCIAPAVRGSLHLDPSDAWAGLPLDEAKQQRPPEFAKCLPGRPWPALSKPACPRRGFIEATASGRNVALLLPPSMNEGPLSSPSRDVVRGLATSHCYMPGDRCRVKRLSKLTEVNR